MWIISDAGTQEKYFYISLPERERPYHFIALYSYFMMNYKPYFCWISTDAILARHLTSAGPNDAGGGNESEVRGSLHVEMKKIMKRFLVEEIFVVGNVKYNGLLMRAIWVNIITLWRVGMSSRVLILFILFQAEGFRIFQVPTIWFYASILPEGELAGRDKCSRNVFEIF